MVLRDIRITSTRPAGSFVRRARRIPEAVEEALCFGWIDSKAKQVDIHGCCQGRSKPHGRKPYVVKWTISPKQFRLSEGDLCFWPQIFFLRCMANSSKHGPIILVEDDQDDQDVTREVIKMIGYKNEIIAFSTCNEAFDYLIGHLDIQPFIILSDVNIPETSGIDFKQRIDDTPLLRQKSIPFVFHSTSADKVTVNNAYKYSVQGFFLKGNSMKEMAATLTMIFDYWVHCKHPNN